MEAWIWVVLVLVVALGICGFVMYRQMREQEAREQGEQQV